MINFSEEEAMEIRALFNASTDEQLINKLEEYKIHIKNNSKKFYSARIVFKGVRRILYCDEGDYKLCGESFFYTAKIRDLYYFDSIESIIKTLLKINRLPYLGGNTIEIWQESDAGEDKLLFKIVQV